MDFDNATITILDPATGEQQVLGTTSSISWDDNVEYTAINVRNSYKFECQIEGLESAAVKKMCEGTQGWKDACRLADTLNDLIEEYHAPGTPRKERRAIKREFDKVFRIFRKHCRTYRIDFSFEKSNK